MCSRNLPNTIFYVPNPSLFRTGVKVGKDPSTKFLSGTSWTGLGRGRSEDRAVDRETTTTEVTDTCEVQVTEGKDEGSRSAQTNSNTVSRNLEPANFTFT